MECLHQSGALPMVMVLVVRMMMATNHDEFIEAMRNLAGKGECENENQ
jgi:hypothetical protein